MLLGRVIDNVWSTRKDESLTGVKFMIVQLEESIEEKNGRLIVAADLIGAGVGEKVLITQGSSARHMEKLQEAPIDAVIIGIIDDEKKDN